MEFLLTGEPLAIDLVNTRPNVDGQRIDLLATPAALAAWLAIEGTRVPTAVVSPTAAHLAAVHEVRDAAEAALAAAREGHRPPAGALLALSTMLRRAPVYQDVAWQAGRVVADDRRVGAQPARLAADLAAATVELLAIESVADIRQCEAPGCVLLFLAANQRRRWCSAARCGNRVRVARYYQRHTAR